MSRPCLLYITDRTAFPGDEPARRSRLLEKISEAARCGVDYIQLREKDLTARELESLARQAIRAMHQNSTQKAENQDPTTDHWPLTTALLINSRTDVALAAGADGVHLRSDDISPQEARLIWKRGAGALACENSPPVITVSCHSAEEVAQASANKATFAVFAPVFEKKREIPQGSPALQRSLPSDHSSPCPRRNHAGKRPLLSRSRSRRNRRHPPLPGKQHRRRSAPPSPKFLKMLWWVFLRMLWVPRSFPPSFGGKGRGF